MALIQQLDRTVHTTSSGIEITRLFYVKPYAFHTLVMQRLQGSVQDGQRLAPLRDPYIRNCYCNECVTTFADPRVNAGADSLDEDGGDVGEQLEVLKEPLPNTAGAFVTAHYRPLITAFPTDDPNGTQWDWIDPIVQPGIRQIRWPLGLYISIDSPFFGAGSPDAVPDDSGDPLTIVIHDVSIRRILVDQVDWDGIAAAAGTVNRRPFPSGLPNNKVLPIFRPGTLKYMGSDVVNMLDASGNRWYEVTHRFKWITHWSRITMDALGQAKDNWITWNHILMRPRTAQLGWYPVWQAQDQNSILVALQGVADGFAARGGPLHNEADFMELFR